MDSGSETVNEVFLKLIDISPAFKNVLIKFTSRYDDNADGGSGAGIFIDDFRIYKESSGGYAAPTGLIAEAGDSVVELSWNDMNMSGTDDFYFHNDTVIKHGLLHSNLKILQAV